MPERVLIAGAGLAGACAALYLSKHADVHVVEAERPAAGASGAAAGLVNPLMGRKANPVWRLHEALDAVPACLDEAGARDLFRGGGVLRPTVEEAQVEFFKDAVAAHPDLATWLTEAEVEERFPDVTTAGGAMHIPKGGAIHVPAMVDALLSAAQDRGATVETGARVAGWGESSGTAFLDVARTPASTSDAARGEARLDTERLSGSRVLLCLGQGYPDHDELRALGLTGIKGQTVHVRRPPSSGTGPLLPMSGRGYVVPNPNGTLILGSSYDHDFDDLEPDPEQTEYILNKTSNMLPGVTDAEVLGVTAGVRVKHEETNLPVVGPLPGRDRVWTFTALGSKGLLTAPLLASKLHGYLREPATIPVEVRTPA